MGCDLCHESDTENACLKPEHDHELVRHTDYSTVHRRYIDFFSSLATLAYVALHMRLCL